MRFSHACLVVGSILAPVLGGGGNTEHFADDPIDVFVCDLAGPDPFMPAPAVVKG